VTHRPRGWAAAAALVLVLGVASGCGQKGPPLPPYHAVPASIGDLNAERRDDRVTLKFTVPPPPSGPTIAAVDRVEIYGMSIAAAAPTPASVVILDPKNLLTTVAVKPQPPPQPAGGKSSKAKPAPAANAPPPAPDPRPGLGDAATFVEKVPAEAVSAGLTRYYVALALSGRKRSPNSPVVSVPLARTPASPSGVTIDNDEQTLKVTWTGAAPGQLFRVYEVPPPGAPAAPPALLTDTPLKTAEFTTPVEFGRERCFTVSAVETVGRTSFEGADAPATCKTPRDTFAPEAPTKLVAVAGEGGVDLVWTGVTAPDLAGYIVLRRPGQGGTLQPLMRAPISELTYRDTTAQAGMTYVYAVYAVDKAGNVSELSNQQEVTAREIWGIRELGNWGIRELRNQGNAPSLPH